MASLLTRIGAVLGLGQPAAASDAEEDGVEGREDSEIGPDGMSGWERGRKAAVAGIHVAGWYSHNSCYSLLQPFRTVYF
eukprot:COSAG02_NODE_3993_length_5942_cov_2.729249_3_plen_79_part_00